MTLKEWIKKEGMPVATLAKKIKVAVWSVDRYVRTGRVPAPRVVLALYKVTRGEVQPNDFYRLPKGRA